MNFEEPLKDYMRAVQSIKVILLHFLLNSLQKRGIAAAVACYFILVEFSCITSIWIWTIQELKCSRS